MEDKHELELLSGEVSSSKQTPHDSLNLPGLLNAKAPSKLIHAACSEASGHAHVLLCWSCWSLCSTNQISAPHICDPSVYFRSPHEAEPIRAKPQDGLFSLS